MKLKFSGLAKNVKPRIEIHDTERAPMMDVSIATTLSAKQLIELLGGGSEDMVYALWDDDDRPISGLASGSTELTLQPAKLKVDCDVISIEPFTMEDGKCSKFAFTTVDGAQVDLTMNFACPFAATPFSHLVNHALQVKDKDIFFELSGQQVRLALGEGEDDNQTQLNMDESDNNQQEEEKAETVVTKADAKAKGFRTEPPPPPPVPQNDTEIMAAIDRIVEGMGCPDDLCANDTFARFKEVIQIDRQNESANYITIGMDDDIIIRLGENRELHIGPAANEDSEFDYEITAVKPASGRLIKQAKLRAGKNSLQVARFVADFLNADLNKAAG